MASLIPPGYAIQHLEHALRLFLDLQMSHNTFGSTIPHKQPLWPFLDEPRFTTTTALMALSLFFDAQQQMKPNNSMFSDLDSLMYLMSYGNTN